MIPLSACGPCEQSPRDFPMKPSFFAFFCGLLFLFACTTPEQAPVSDAELQTLQNRIENEDDAMAESANAKLTIFDTYPQTSSYLLSDGRSIRLPIYDTGCQSVLLSGSSPLEKVERLLP